MTRIKTVKNSPRFAVIHIAKSLEKAAALPKLVKEYACPNPPKDRVEEGSTGYNKKYSAYRN